MNSPSPASPETPVETCPITDAVLARARHWRERGDLLRAGEFEILASTYSCRRVPPGHTPGVASTPPPPPADGPGMAQAARTLAAVAADLWLEGPGDRVVTFERYQAAKLEVERALAAEAEREKLRRRALRLWRQRDPDQHVPPVVVAALDEWADAESAETSR